MRAKKAAVLCIIGASAMFLLAGCKSSEKETEKTTENRVETEAPKETEAEPSTFISSSETFSIDLPDATWTPSGEVTDGKWEFTSADGSAIQIVHKKTPIGKKKLAKTPEKAQKLLDKIKKDAFRNIEHEIKTEEGADIYYYYGAQTADPELGYAYYGRSIVNTDTEGYIITAKFSPSDEELAVTVKKTLTSFQILKEDGGESDSGEKTDGKETSGDSGNDSQEEQDGSSGDGSQSSGEESRYFFDEAGNTVYAYPSDDGAWRDENGMVYYFYENGVEDKDGNWFYYDPPEYRDGGTGASADAGQVADFYDKDGNYITATQDASGNWIGDDGKTYVLSDEGVTDSDGNFVPW